MANLYANENFPLPVVQELRKLGHDVLTIQESGLANREYPDEKVLQIASEEDRAVLTINRKHFRRLHQQTRQHAGIILCTADRDFVGQAQRIHQALEFESPMEGKLIRVNRPLR